jgi:hypothetical protein
VDDILALRVFFLNPEYKMSSVTRFLRQVPTGLQYAATSGDITTTALDFVPTSGNYVGNYPPGYVVPAAQTGLSAALADAAISGSDAFIRDMGKTIFCPYAATIGATFTNYGYFRQYQALVPTPITATQGFIGGNGGNTFGVVGPATPLAASGTSTYVTFYLPVAVGGVGAANAATFPSAYPAAGGQM